MASSKQNLRPACFTSLEVFGFWLAKIVKILFVKQIMTQKLKHLTYNIYRKRVRRLDMKVNNTETKMDKNTKEALKNLESALKIYKISEIYANDVNDDYGKKKIASLRLEFAKHELADAWEKASQLGIVMENYNIFKETFLK